MISAQGSTGSSSSRGRPSNPISTNPLGGLLANLFGVPATLDPKRQGIVLGFPQGTSAFRQANREGKQGNFFPAPGVGGIPSGRELGGPTGGLAGLANTTPTSLGATGGFTPSGFSDQGLIGQSGPGFGFAPQTFVPSDFLALRDQIEPVQRLFQNQTPGVLGGLGLGGLEDALSLFDESINPALQELTETGFRTDIGPIRDQALQQFRDQTIPGIAQQFASSASGPFSSDFLRSVTQAAGGLETNLGAQQVGLDEAAAARRAAGLPVAAELGAFRANLPVGFAEDLLALQEASRLEELGSRPGAQISNLLQLLGGVPTGAIQAGNITSSSSRNQSGGGGIG